MKAIAKLAVCSLLLVSALYVRAEGAPSTGHILTFSIGTDSGIGSDDEGPWLDEVPLGASGPNGFDC